MPRSNKKTIWFPAKKYGIGWGLPITWQGWLVLLMYVALSILGTVYLGNNGYSIFIPFYIILLTSLLILVCWKKGEKLSWRWGKQK
ncbi:MAG TPA: hypothetical protein ENJ28_09530 [Gammaproteobacteria bacterium]|nr:hypothetical protein [Gammaproteobacteria bacterium]